MTATLVTPTDVALGAPSVAAWAMALAPSPDASKQTSGNELNMLRFMEIKNSSSLLRSPAQAEANFAS